MRQPVSRISFDRRRGFLGAYLQEGALFVDAVWNEAADIAWSQLRDAIIAAGITGSAGHELRIDPVIRDQRLVNLVVRGTGALPPRPFYGNGLPVLWPSDVLIDAQAIGDGFRAEATGPAAVPAGRTWIDLLQDVGYEIYLRARVETLDRLDDPDLDDPGLDATRGSFRKRVVGEVRIARARDHRPPLATNIQLSVDGSYRSDLNALYRVELDALTGTRSAPAASVLWDPDAAATVARVVDPAWSRLKTASPFAWPHGLGSDASILPQPDGNAEFLFLYDLKEGKMALAANDGARFECLFDSKTFPCCWFFASYGALNDAVTGVLEPCTNMPVSVNEAAAGGYCACLQPGATLAATVTWVATGAHNRGIL